MAGNSSFFHLLVRNPRRLALRGWLFQIHLWTGVGVGLYILVMSLSGTALVFREELEAAYPARARTVATSGPRAPLEAVRQTALRRYPSYKVAWIHEPDRPDLAHDVWVETDTDARLVLVDPYGAKFLSEVGATTTFWKFLQDLHFYLFAGRVGFLINGIGGLLLGMMCLTGLFLWWPGRRKWRRALTVDWSSRWRRLNWDLHGAGGLWTLAFIGTWAMTGAYFAFPQPFATAVGAMLPMSAPVPEPAVPVAGTKQVSVDQLVSRAMMLVPGTRPTWIGLPHHEGDRLAQVQLLPTSSDDPDATTTVFFNSFTAELIEIRRPEQQKVGDRVLSWFVRLHFGNFGGWPVKVIWTIVGLSPAALFVTGFLMWWNRVLSKRWRQRRAQRNVSEPETNLAQGAR